MAVEGGLEDISSSRGHRRTLIILPFNLVCTPIRLTMYMFLTPSIFHGAEQPKELGCFLVIAQKYDRRHNSFFNGPSSDIEAALSILRPHFPPKRSKWASELSTANSSRSFSRPITPRPQIDLTSLRDRILDWTHSSDA